jgi:hypothetical protein
MKFDKIIIGAGLFGLYAAIFSAKRGEHVLVIEYEDQPFKRASTINQARVHMGYHYPRSLSTAIKSKEYVDRFYRDFGFCINSEFDQLYAISSNFSWTNAEQFVKFCKNAGIRCEEISASKYFRPAMCDGAFLTSEYSYDANILIQHLMKVINTYPNITLIFSAEIVAIHNNGLEYHIILQDGKEYHSCFVLNTTYAGVNQIHKLLNFDYFDIKYELCEVMLCKVNENLQNLGITVMDGPFFSIMPYGESGLHSLTSVTFTPHFTCFDDLPVFDCQKQSNGFCSSIRLGNCNTCPAKPQSAWPYMNNLVKKYLKTEYQIEFVKSLYSIKPILMTSEIDDSRPTVIKQYSENPAFYSVLSGKINTIYDLDEVLGK